MRSYWLPLPLGEGWGEGLAPTRACSRGFARSASLINHNRSLPLDCLASALPLATICRASHSIRPAVVLRSPLTPALSRREREPVVTKTAPSQTPFARGGKETRNGTGMNTKLVQHQLFISPVRTSMPKETSKANQQVISLPISMLISWHA